MRSLRSLEFLKLVLIIFVFGSLVIVAQTQVAGEWTASVKADKPDKIQLNFSRAGSGGGRSSHGSGFAFADLEGLTLDRAQSGGPVSFRLVREAGTIEARGTFSAGRGQGTFRFLPNMSIVDAMRSRGFDLAKDGHNVRSSKENPGDRHEAGIEEKLFTAAMLNVTTALADDLRSANFDDLTVGDLYKAAIFKVDGKFMAEMKATGFPDLEMEDLVKARIFKIDAPYVKGVRDSGYPVSDFEQLVKFRIFKVTPEFLDELKGLGFVDLNPEQVVKFRIFNISSDFIRQARTDEPNITIEQLVERKIGIRKRN